MKNIKCILVLLFIFQLASVQAQSAKQHYKAGEEFFKGRQYNTAVEQYTKAIELDPDLEKAYIQRAKAQAYQGDHLEAAKDFDLALALQKKLDEQLLYWAGKEWYLAKENGEALNRLTKAINMKSSFREAYMVRFEVFLEMEDYSHALNDANKCLKLQQDAQAHFNMARVYEKMERFDQSENSYKLSISKNSRLPNTHYRYANLLYEREKYPTAEVSINNALRLSPKSLDYIVLQSQILAAQKDYPKAKEVLSIASIDNPDSTIIYESRGDYDMAMHQPGFAIMEYSKAIELNNDNPMFYHKRARAYEESQQIEHAMKDYTKLLALSRFDGDAQRLYEEGKQRLFELNRESDKPVVSLVDPTLNQQGGVDVSKDMIMLNVTGMVEDQSEITSLQVNGFTVQPELLDQGYRFRAVVNMQNATHITVETADIYENYETAIFPIRITETDVPLVKMIHPYTTDDQVLHVESLEGYQLLEGKIEDESQIVSITVDSVQASFKPNSLNPSFAAQIDLTNKTKVTLRAEDKFGNVFEQSYKISREAVASSNNPMGKTWVVFIENSAYRSFASLEGPPKDVATMKNALTDFDIHRILVKKDMALSDMTSFFNIELRDEIRKNGVNSLLIWYAGHGKYINETGYWVPIDASRGVEHSYYNINALKASMHGYNLDHTLVITDACETGPSFYQAMRSDISEPSCDDYRYTRFQSSQVLTSAGYELALDDSKFTEVFSRVLHEKRSNCVPIESVVLRVMDEVGESTQQKPKFGKIEGLPDQNGTFFFIPKDF